MPTTFPPFENREQLVQAIMEAGRYIADHAENLLGEYPSLLNKLDITARVRFDEPTSVEIRRVHFVCAPTDYPEPEPQTPWYARGGVFDVNSGDER